MRIVRDYQFITEADQGAAIAIGNFDGVHIGHRAVIDLAREQADRLEAPLGVMTFEPHPRQLFAPDAPPFRLTGPAARAHRLEKYGVDILYELTFNAALAALPPDKFVQRVLVDGLGVRHVVVGADFHFGAKRAGTTEMLTDFGDRLGFGVTVAKLVAEGDAEVSSTAIREALAEGEPRDAAAMLGHRHRIEGPVIRGDQRGRDLGFPTANMSLTGLHQPKYGVYAVLADVLSGPHKGRYQGAASIGIRPQFDGETPNLETYLFDFKGDIYDETISIALVEYLRPETKFDSIDALIAQMEADCTAARRILDAI